MDRLGIRSLFNWHTRRQHFGIDDTMARNVWTRDETLVAFNIYCRTPFGRLHGRNPEIVATAKRLGRTPNALAMKCCNLAAFDSSLAVRGIKGLAKASQVDERLWHEFREHPEDVAFESEQAFSRLSRCEMRAESEVRWEDVQGLDRSAIAKVRVNQHFFRSIVISGYRGQCAVCELPLPGLLVASHIVPWCVDRTERMNPENGICLCVMHDRAFDRGLLAIGEDYKISVHGIAEPICEIDSIRDYFLRFEGRTICLPDRWHPAPHFLLRHAEIIANVVG